MTEGKGPGKGQRGGSEKESSSTHMNSSYDQYQGGVFRAERRIFSVTCVQNEEEEANNQWGMRLVR